MPAAKPSGAAAPVVDAIEDIRGVCQSYTVEVGSGDNKRTETRYRCELVGKQAAAQAMAWGTASA